MRKLILPTLLCILFSSTLHAQSINNTLGSGGTFTIKNDVSDPLVVVDEAGNADVNGQLTVDRIRVSGVPSFAVYHNTETDMGNNDTLLTWSESTGYGSHDNSNSFNPATGEFVAPRNGFYFLSAGIELGTPGVTGTVTLYIMVDAQYSSLTLRGVPNGGIHLNTSGVVKLNSGDIVTVRVVMGGTPVGASSGLGWFSGYLVSDF